MSKFGVCVCNFNEYDPKIENLVQFDRYEDACKYYMEQIADMRNVPDCLWVVFIENDEIVQFERLQNLIKCKRILIKG